MEDVRLTGSHWLEFWHTEQTQTLFIIHQNWWQNVSLLSHPTNSREIPVVTDLPMRVRVQRGTKSDLTNSNWEGVRSCTCCLCFPPLYGSILEMRETVTGPEWTRQHKCNHDVKSCRRFSSFTEVFTPLCQSGIATQLWPFLPDMLSLFPPRMGKLNSFYFWLWLFKHEEETQAVYAVQVRAGGVMG